VVSVSAFGFLLCFVTVDWMTGLKSKTNLCHCILFWKKWRKLTDGDQSNRFLCKMAIDKFLSYYSIICVVCMRLLITFCTLYVLRRPYCGTIFPKFSVSFSMQFVTTFSQQVNTVYVQMADKALYKVAFVSGCAFLL